MSDSRVKKLADVLVNYSNKIQPGEWVHINASLEALPLAKEVAAAVVAAGGHFTVNMGTLDFKEILMKEGNDDQLEWASPLQLEMIKNVDSFIVINAPENTRSLSGVDPARQQLWSKSQKEWREIYMKRSAEGDLRWTITNYPCQALAQDADMSLSDYEDFVYGATFADQDDPMAAWQKIHDEQQRLVDWMVGKKKVTIKGPNADISMSIDGRSFINSDGDKNMPSGEIYTSPVEDSVEGWVKFTYPAIYRSIEVEGVYLEFNKGKVVKATAEKNEETLLKTLETDEGASYLGELGIGTNFGIQKFTKSILYDEKIGGTFHLAVGNGFPQAGGKNKSIVHWDLICDAKKDTEMRVDGELFYQNGKFMV
jgi:aminopeptidase